MVCKVNENIMDCTIICINKVRISIPGISKRNPSGKSNHYIIHVFPYILT